MALHGIGKKRLAQLQRLCCRLEYPAIRQGAQHGFVPLDVRVTRSERVSHRQGRSGRYITLQVVQYDGLLRVEDTVRLGQALVNGIGHAKALGLGMLSLAPAHT